MKKLNKSIFDIFNKEDNKRSFFIPGMIESNDHTKYFIYYEIWFTQTEDKAIYDICNKRIDCYSNICVSHENLFPECSKFESPPI